MDPSGPDKHLYVFERPESLRTGAMTNVELYYVYAPSKEQAVEKFRMENPELYEKDPSFVPKYLGRLPW